MQFVRYLSLFALAWVPSAAVHATTEGYQSVPVRDGANQPFWLIEPEKPNQIVILFAGGDGSLKIDRGGIGRAGNFLVRTRNDFARQSFVVVVVDAPDDHAKLSGFRTTADHARDIGTVMAFVRQRYPGLKLWLIGTSRGTISAANAAARLQGTGGPDGLVLTSSVTRKGGKRSQESLDDLNLGEISVPTYVVHHKQDGCRVTPVNGAEELLRSLSGAKAKELRLFTGGGSSGDPCQGGSHHGFEGIESQVVSDIAAWIKAH